MPEPFTIEKAFPVLGTYALVVDGDSAQVTVSLDSVSKGIVWIEGLPQGKFKAYLKQSPVTYRIISQKSESGRQLPEGTLYLDQENNVLQIAIGKNFNDANPTAVFEHLNLPGQGDVAQLSSKKSKTKSGKKIVFYTANKILTPQTIEEVVVETNDATTGL